MRFLGVVFLSTVFLACGFADGGVNVDPEFQHKIELDPGAARVLSVEWQSGGIELIGDDGDDVRITSVGRKYGGLIRPEEWLEFAEFGVAGGKVTLGFTHPGAANPYSIALQVRFPRAMAVEVENGSGELTLSGGSSAVVDLASGGVTITGVTGDVEVETASGGIEVEDVGGSLKAYSASGGLEIKHIAGTVEAGTASGGIEIELDANHGGTVTADTASGGIGLCFGPGQAGPVTLNTASGGIDLSYGGPFTGDADLDTGSGGIAVNLTNPPGGLAIEAETASGRASTNHPDAQVSNECSSGEIRLKGTGPKLTLSTASGSVEVNVR
jgi:DUF4097 and DUF4098 domain-containing protein YvlB